MLTHIDHVILPTPDLETSAARFEQLGLRLMPPTRHAHQGTENRAWFVGGGDSEFYVELLGVHDRGLAHEAGRDDVLHALDGAGGLWRVMLATSDLAGVRARLEGAGVRASHHEVARDGGAKICDVLVPETKAAGCAFAAIQYTEDSAARCARHAAAGLFEHDFPLKRLDHLAAIVHDLEGATRFWTDVLGVPVSGEVPMGAGLIRQMKMGDAILEIIGPATADSPLRQRPEGLISMCAFEVGDLDGAVTTLRGRGFTSSDPGPGPLPGTRVSSIPAPELAGMTLQLLEYV
jgi:catechol 2,3-dioxygenase-like lactoylglutathione lyase family enzyme